MSTDRRRFGSIRKLPSGRFQARYRDPTGRLISADRTFATTTDANRFLSSVQADLDRGAWFDPQRGKVPFGNLIIAWRLSRPNLRETTIAAYSSHLKTMILPYFADMNADQISNEVVRHWHQWVSTRPLRSSGGLPTTQGHSLSPNSVAKAYRLLRSILEVAVDDGVISQNPCRLRGVASERSPEQRVAAASEIHRIVEAIDDRYRAMILLAAYGGLRTGELIGLRRSCVDFAQGAVRVVEQVTQPDGGPAVVGPPKTEAGKRTVRLPPEVMANLDAHLQAYGEPGSNGLVFPAPKGGYLRRSNFRRRTWLPALKAAGMDGLRFHDLRHSHATIAVSLGIDTATLMARMGHSSSRAAMIYQHAGSDDTIVTGFSKVLAQAAKTDSDAKKVRVLWSA